MAKRVPGSMRTRKSLSGVQPFRRSGALLGQALMVDLQAFRRDHWECEDIPAALLAELRRSVAGSPRGCDDEPGSEAFGRLELLWKLVAAY